MSLRVLARWVATLVFLLSCAPASGQDAPRVVSLSPADLATIEAGAVTELVIVFDREMDQASGYSFVGGGPSFPPPRGPASWRDARTIVLPVELAADRAYRLQLNSERHQRFRSKEGVPLLPRVWTFDTRPAVVRPKEEQRARNERAYREVQSGILERYSYRDRVVKDWALVFAEHAEAVLAAPSDLEFAKTLLPILALAEDPHLSLECNGQRLAAQAEGRDPLYRRAEVQRLIPLQAIGTFAAVGRTSDGLGYLAIESFSDALDMAAIDRALLSLMDCRGIVLDVRANGGGDERLAQQIAGWFVRGRPAYAKHRILLGPDRFGVPVSRRVSGHKAPRQFHGPVVVLIGPSVASSAESFVLMMKKGPDVTLIGRPTRGSSGNPKPFALANGVLLHLPSWQQLDLEGRQTEGEPLAPDHLIACEAADWDTGDPILLRALEQLRERRRESEAKAPR